MKALVTGATGFVGYHLARLLRDRGWDVRALVRSESDTSAIEELGIEIRMGDIRDIESLYSAFRGCSHVYHLAADYRLWVPDPRTMYDINVTGTRNVMHAALMLNIEKVVYTSTAGVLSPSRRGRVTTEQTLTDVRQMVGHYKTSKFIAEREVDGFAGKGLQVVIVNPTTPLGAMDRKPTPTGRIIVDFMNRRIPAYLDTGLNLVDVEDVAAGHLLAAEKGVPGRRYILGNRNATLKEFFELLAAATGIEPPKFKMPYLPVLMAAHFESALSKMITGRPPRISVAGVQMVKHYMHFDCTRAISELHIPQTPVEKSIARAVQWFQANGYVECRAKQCA